MRHEHRLTVRSHECDANGHVNNAVYLNYLEDARVAFLRAVGTSYRELIERGFGLMVVQVKIDYRGQAFMEDPLLVVTQPIGRRYTGGTFSQKVYREEGSRPVLIADAEVTWVCVNSEKKPARLPPFLATPALDPVGEEASETRAAEHPAGNPLSSGDPG